MSCPDCIGRDAFHAELVEQHGEPVMLNGIAYYANPDMRPNMILDPARWARALCPVHGSKNIPSQTEPEATMP